MKKAEEYEAAVARIEADAISLTKEEEALKAYRSSLEKQKEFIPEYEAKANEIGKLEALLPRYEVLEFLQKEVDRLSSEITLKETARDTAAREITEIDKNLKALNEDFRTLEDSGERLVKANSLKDDLKRRMDGLDGLLSDIRNLKNEEKTLVRYQNALRQRMNEKMLAVNEYETAYNLFLSEQAGLLAKGMEYHVLYVVRLTILPRHRLPSMYRTSRRSGNLRRRLTICLQRWKRAATCALPRRLSWKIF